MSSALFSSWGWPNLVYVFGYPPTLYCSRSSLLCGKGASEFPALLTNKNEVRHRPNKFMCLRRIQPLRNRRKNGLPRLHC